MEHQFTSPAPQTLDGWFALHDFRIIDWQRWGVTLFADDPLQFKKLVYEMRFDEGSARFGEFGPFLVGERIKDSNLSRLLRA